MASPANYEFVDKVPEDHHCTICTNILTDPVLTGCCGQHFCNGCLKNWLRRKKTCPHCQTDNFQCMKNLRMKRAIDSLKIYCPNRSKGCDKITTLGECNQHLEKCLFVEVSCTKKCGKKIFRKELQDHEDNKCPNRLIKCQYCNTDVMYKEVTATSHLDSCSGFPISCPNNCGHEKVQRTKLAGHQMVCPLEPVKCPFFEAGCSEIVVRKDLAAHKASNTEHHLELMMTETVSLKQEGRTTKDRLQQLSVKFDGLASCVTKQLGTIGSNPRNTCTQAAINNIKSSLETMTTMLAPGDTQYYLPLVKVSEYRARSASFYIKPGYKMYVNIDSHDNCTVYLEKGEHDHQLKWPMPELEIKLHNKVDLCGVTICAVCDLTVNQLKGDKTQQCINPRQPRVGRVIQKGVQKDLDFVFLTVRPHDCEEAMFMSLNRKTF
ncbi:TNF receptor-associated factor 5-like [Halichondria panicea]|uniref:TNF receptor-associated factor 5-like n=1 Tax=Halichondria panicea TaxID=6063 RepID=UPI00312B6360